MSDDCELFYSESHVEKYSIKLIAYNLFNCLVSLNLLTNIFSY